MGGRGSQSGAKSLDKSVQRGIIEENSKRMAENDVIMRYIRVLSELSGQLRFAT